MMRCEYCGFFIPENSKYCPGCGAEVVDVKEKKSKNMTIGRFLGKILVKFLALILFLIISVVHMVVIFICVYGGMILSCLSGIVFFISLLGILLIYMEPELGYTWSSIIPCFGVSCVLMFLPMIGEGISMGLGCLMEFLLDIVTE